MTKLCRLEIHRSPGAAGMITKKVQVWSTQRKESQKKMKEVWMHASDECMRMMREEEEKEEKDEGKRSMRKGRKRSKRRRMREEESIRRRRSKKRRSRMKMERLRVPGVVFFAWHLLYAWPP